MKLHNYHFLMHADLEKSYDEWEAWQKDGSPNKELYLLEKFIMRNQRSFMQPINARMAPHAGNGNGLGAKEVFDVIKGFPTSDAVVVKKYVITLEFDKTPKVNEVEATSEERLSYLRELIEREVGLGRDAW